MILSVEAPVAVTSCAEVPAFVVKGDSVLAPVMVRDVMISTVSKVAPGRVIGADEEPTGLKETGDELVSILVRYEGDLHLTDTPRDVILHDVVDGVPTRIALRGLVEVWPGVAMTVMQAANRFIYEWGIVRIEDFRTVVPKMGTSVPVFSMSVDDADLT